jgi:hypothetical protein
VGGVRWTEEMTGYVSFDQTDFNQALMEGRRDGASLSLRMTIQIDDIGAFIRGDRVPNATFPRALSSHKRAWVSHGHLESPDLRGRMDVTWGEFELLGPANDLFDHLHLRMRYRLNLTDALGCEYRLAGFKQIENDPGGDSWSDTTTLFTRIYTGSWRTPHDPKPTLPDPWAEEDAPGDERGGEGLIATGIIELSRLGFLRELASFRGTEGPAWKQLRDVLRFGGCFFGGLAKAYVGPNVTDGDPSFPRDYPPLPAAGETPPQPAPQEGEEPGWHLVPERAVESAGRFSLERRIVTFRVPGLPFPLNLHHLRIAGVKRRGARGPVLLAHGAGVRAQMFYGQPSGETIVDRLLRERYDVWALNWRGSIDFHNNSYTLDEVARFDHPAAVKKVLEETGKRSLRALVHCQGSVSFLMAAVAGYLKRPGSEEDLVSDVVSSAISLFFEVPDRTWLKQRLTLPLVTRIGKGADPQWGIRAINTAAKAIAAVSRGSERPCNNAPCQIANFIYGAGWDVLLCHANVDDDVHAWTARELGYTPFSLISQVAESSRYGHITPSAWAFAPSSYVGATPDIRTTRFTFLGCTRDTMFQALGQERSARFLDDCGLQADYVALNGYGHMDAYWGRDAARDVFPSVLAGLEWSESGRVPSEKPRAEPFSERLRRPCAPDARERAQLSEPFSAPPPPRSRVR